MEGGARYLALNLGGVDLVFKFLQFQAELVFKKESNKQKPKATISAKL